MYMTKYSIELLQLKNRSGRVKTQKVKRNITKPISIFFSLGGGHFGYIVRGGTSPPPLKKSKCTLGYATVVVNDRQIHSLKLINTLYMTPIFTPT